MKEPMIPGESPADRKKRRERERYWANRDKKAAENKARYHRNRDAYRATARAYHEANREKANAGRMARYLADHEGNKAKLRESYRKFREKRNAETKADYYANREKYLALRKANAAANPERERASGYRSRQARRLNVPYKALIKSARERAKKKGVPFDLTEAWAKSIWTGRCSITGIEFKLGLNGCGPKTFSPSIDRIVPSLGYVPDNCRFVIWAVNAFKYDGTDEDMYAIAEAILANRKCGT